jgi:hypothetical protein
MDASAVAEVSRWLSGRGVDPGNDAIDTALTLVNAGEADRADFLLCLRRPGECDDKLAARMESLFPGAADVLTELWRKYA